MPSLGQLDMVCRSGVDIITQAHNRGHSDIVSALAAGGAVLQPSDFDDKTHAETTAQLQMSNSIMVTRHQGGGYVLPDYTLTFRDFNTFVVDVRLCRGFFYFEVRVLEIESSSNDPEFDDIVQFGYCTDGFQKNPADQHNHEGVGDDASSWAVDGCRQRKWHRGEHHPFSSRWVNGDVIGFLLDMQIAGSAVMSISVNGVFDSPNGVAFSDIDAPYLSPAFTGDGRFRLNFGDRPFAHQPPDANVTSVHAFFHMQKR